RLETEQVEVDIAVLHVERRLIDVVRAERHDIDGGTGASRLLREDRLWLSSDQRCERSRDAKRRRPLKELSPSDGAGRERVEQCGEVSHVDHLLGRSAEYRDSGCEPQDRLLVTRAAGGRTNRQTRRTQGKGHQPQAAFQTPGRPSPPPPVLARRT